MIVVHGDVAGCRLARKGFPQIQHHRHARGLPGKFHARHGAIGPVDIFRVGEMLIMILHALAPSFHVFRPGQPLAEHDLVVTGVGIEEHLDASR